MLGVFGELLLEKALFLLLFAMLVPWKKMARS